MRVDGKGWEMTGRSVKLGVAIFTVSGALVATIIPENPMEYIFFRELVAYVGAIIPAVHRVAIYSPVPEFAQVFWALMWIKSLLWLPYYFRMSDEKYSPIKVARARPMVYQFQPILILAFLVVMYFWPWDSLPSRRLISSEIVLGVIGSFLFAYVPVSIRYFSTWKRYIKILD